MGTEEINKESHDISPTVLHGHFGGSVIKRVLVTTTILLILPLFFISSLMYLHEYREKTNNNFTILSIIAAGISQKIDLYRFFDHAILDMLDQSLTISQLPTFPNEKINNLFANVVIRDEVTALMYLQKQGTQYKCITSSSPQFLGDDFTAVIGTHSLDPDEIQIFTYPIYANEENAIIFLKRTKHLPEGFLTIIINSHLMHEKVMADLVSDYPITISFVNPEGTIISTNNKNYLNDVVYRDAASGVVREKDQTSIYLTPIKTGASKYTFLSDGQKRMAVTTAIPGLKNFLLLVDASESENLVDLQQYFIRWVQYGFLAIIAGWVASFWLSTRFAKPLESIHECIDKVTQGDLDVQYQEDSLGFELNIIGKKLEAMVAALKTYIEQVKNEKSEKEVLSRELQLGQEIQMSLLPKHLYALENVIIGTGYISAKEVGGDFYDVIPLINKDDGYLIAMADASGKGVFACLYSLTLRSILRSYATSFASIETLFHHVNATFVEDTADSGAFVTAWIGQYIPSKNQLVYSNAGHFPAVLIAPDGSVQELTSDGIAFGAITIEHVDIKSITVVPKSILVLYTDGIVEACDQSGKMYGKARLLALLAANRQLSPQEIAGVIMHDVIEFSKNAPQADDITVMVALLL